jgi:murein DD-endopeptidase MepM/ murein hydrolase activator NlpD
VRIFAVLLQLFPVVAAAAAPPAPSYRLPWPEGRSFTITQAPGGWITTHVLKSNRYAVDIAMPEGTPVLAARQGVVEETQWRSGGGAGLDPLTDSGNYVLVRHEDGTLATYAHLRYARVVVVSGEAVAAGGLLGYSGTTGFSSGPHLHFGVSRTESAGGREVEVSVPVTFTIGVPPLAFAPRAALTVTANYSSAAELPQAASERRMFERQTRVLSSEELPWAWLGLALWVAAGVAGMAWCWRFSNSKS